MQKYITKHDHVGACFLQAALAMQDQLRALVHNSLGHHLLETALWQCERLVAAAPNEVSCCNRPCTCISAWLSSLMLLHACMFVLLPCRQTDCFWPRASSALGKSTVPTTSSSSTVRASPDFGILQPCTQPYICPVQGLTMASSISPGLLGTSHGTAGCLCKLLGARRCIRALNTLPVPVYAPVPRRVQQPGCALPVSPVLLPIGAVNRGSGCTAEPPQQGGGWRGSQIAKCKSCTLIACLILALLGLLFAL